MIESIIRAKVTITRSEWNRLSIEARLSADGLETGGILLGHDDAARMRVVRVGDPGPEAIRRPNQFLRDLTHARRLASEAWSADGSQWIGEWHTHPSADLAPSPADLRSYLTHLNDRELGLERFLAVIVSNVGGTPAAASWIVYESAAYLVPTEIEEES